MRVMIDISYDGSGYEGFAPQPHGRTIADNLCKALEKIYKQKITIYGSSRTDSKVSAMNQYIVYDAPFEINLENIVRAINCNTDSSIYCKSAILVKDRYMPRHDVLNKTYKYTITSNFNPVYRHLQYFIRTKLNVSLMQDAANYLVGTHDFSSFCSSNTDVTDKVRTVNSIEVKANGELIEIIVNGDGFLYNMVRIIVGSLIVFGLEKEKPEYMKTILEAKDRKYAYATAPAHGLMLEEIRLKGSYE